jgi:hypothetical protein
MADDHRQNGKCEIENEEAEQSEQPDREDGA